MVGVEQKILKIWILYTVGNSIFRVFPTQDFNVLLLPNNEDKLNNYWSMWQCYLQFNVTRKMEKILEIWSLQIVRKRIWPCTPGHDASERLYLVGQSIVNSNSTFAHSVVNELLYEK
jgi:hypothetical protein